MSASLQEDDSGDQRVAPAVEGAGQDDPAFPAKVEFQHCGNEATEPDASWSRTLGRPILLAFAASCFILYRLLFLAILSIASTTLTFGPACTRLQPVVARKGHFNAVTGQCSIGQCSAGPCTVDLARLRIYRGISGRPGRNTRVP